MKLYNPPVSEPASYVVGRNDARPNSPLTLDRVVYPTTPAASIMQPTEPRVLRPKQQRDAYIAMQHGGPVPHAGLHRPLPG